MNSINGSIAFFSKTITEENQSMSKIQEQYDKMLLQFIQKENSDLKELKKTL